MGYDIGPKIGIEGEAEFKKAISSIDGSMKVLRSEMKLVTSEFDKNDKSMEALTAQNKVLNKQIDEQRGKVGLLENALKKAESAEGDNTKEIQKLTVQLNKAKADLNGMEQEVKQNEAAMNSAGKSAKSFGEKFSGIGKVVKTAGVAVGAAAVAIGAGLASMVGKATSLYAEYEQSIGGIETLFKNSSDTVVEYANNAYKTAGLSSNEYMATATAVSASLLQSLGGDTAAAADAANMAITDMADNANKMGSDMQSVQDAYKGFAKQNYTMLDNLKLGYGGTKTEMQRLLDDAEKLSGIKYDISNLNDVYSAIHVIQGEMGITGTTAKEASTTIQGSAASMKAAWADFLTGMADPGQDFSALVNNLTDSVLTFADNLVPRLMELVPRLVEGIAQLAGNLAGYLPETLNTITPVITNTLTSMLPSVLTTLSDLLAQCVSAIVQMLPALIPAAVQAVMTITTALIENLPMLVDAALELIITLADGITKSLPVLVPTIVDVVLKIVDTLTDPGTLSTLIDASIAIIIALAEGIIKSLPKLIEKAPEIIANLVTAIIAAVPQLLAAGLEIVVALANSIKDNLSKIGDAGKEMVAGLWAGISEKASWLIGKIKEWCGSILNAVKGFFGIHSPSKVFEDEVGKQIPLGVAKGIDENKDAATKAAVKMAKETYTASKDWIDKQTKYYGMSLKEQLAAWQRVQDQYVTDSEQYLEAEKNVLETKKKIQDEYQKKVEEVNKKITDLENEYQDKLSKRTQEIANSFGLFDEVAAKEQVNGDALVTNLSGQIDRMREFYSDLDALSERGVSEELVESVRKMGVDAAGKLDGLLALSDEKLAEYSNLFGEKQKLANELAIQELENLREETDVKIQEQIDSVQELYDSQAADVGLSLPMGMIRGINAGAADVINAAKGVAMAAVAATQAIMGSMSSGTSSKSSTPTSTASASWTTGNSQRVLPKNGSHASGLSYVPFDGYIAELHKGEAVIPASIMKAIRALDGASTAATSQRNISAIVNGVSAGAGQAGGTYILQTVLDGKVIAQSVFDPLRGIARQRGVALG